MMPIRQFAVTGLLVLALLALPGVASALEVYATILPQKYFIEKIGGERVDVHVLVQPGANPHMYEPTPKQMAALTRAQIYFAVGVTLEDAWLPRIIDSNKDLVIVHSDEGIEKLAMQAHGHHEPAHGEHHGHGGHEYQEHGVHGHGEHEGHEHQEHGVHEHREHEVHGDREHGGGEHHDHGHQAHDEAGYHRDAHHDHGQGGDEGRADPHIWLDPIRVKAMAKNICEGLIGVDPEYAAEYRKNLAAFTAEVDQIHETVATRLSALTPANRTFLVFHPSWGYFADRYGLTQIAVEEAGNEPGPSHLAKVIRHCRENGIRVVFVQPQFSQRSAEVVASEIDGRVVPLDPLAEDWEQNLRKAANAFVEATH